MSQEFELSRNSEEFVEENNKLKKLISEIEYLLANYQRFLPYPDVGHYDTAGDYDEAGELHVKKDANEHVYQSLVVPWKNRIESPYYGRIDCEIDGEMKTFYIGNQDLIDKDSKTIVFNGNGKLGDFYNQTNLSSDTINNHKYEAFLRRQLLIRDKKLQIVIDKYVKGFDAKYNGITDPYLMEVLRRNRKEKGFSSILSSIQENQFNIVSQDYKSSFIVQGCAGSGKTAIMFQRLARIDYRYKGYIDSMVKIITPNGKYNEFINPFSKSLGLDKVQSLTLDDYYLELLRRYNVSLSLQGEDVNSDYYLDPSFINLVYSDSTINNRLFPAGKKYIDSLLKDIDYDRLIKTLSYFDIKEPNPKYRYCLSRISSYLFRASEMINSKVVEKYTKEKNKIEPASEVCEKYCTESGLENHYPDAADISLIKNKIFALVRQLNSGLDSLQIEADKFWLNNPPTVDEVRNLLSDVKRINLEANNKSSSIREEVAKLEKELESLNDDGDKEWEETTYPLLLKELDELKEAQQNLAFLSFVRKQKINNRILEINEEIETHKNGQSGIENRKEEIRNEIVILLSKTETPGLPENLVNECEKLSLWYDAINYLVNNELIIKYGEYLTTILPFITDLLDTKKLTINEMYRKTMPHIINNLCDGYNYKNTQNSTKVDGRYHTFNLYLALSLANLFLYKPATKDKLICIDEGQEYSSNEYALIMDVNSDDDTVATINVYGDINQRTSTKGISNWKQLSFISNSVFELKENYRNSKEIVDFTNHELGLSDIAIGINEEIPVKTIDINEVINEMHKGNTCVIVDENSDAYKLLYDKNLINKTNDSLVVLSPVLAKGQEFPKVIVFDNGMTPVDKYVSYTRAKSELLVCREI